MFSNDFDLNCIPNFKTLEILFFKYVLGNLFFFQSKEMPETFWLCFILTRRLVNVRSRMMFRPELIYIFDLIVNQMKR